MNKDQAILYILKDIAEALDSLSLHELHKSELKRKLDNLTHLLDDNE